MKRNGRLRAIVVRHLLELKAGLSLSAVCLAGHTVTELLAPWPLKLIFDHVLTNNEARRLPAFVARMLPEDRMGALAVLAASVFVLACIRGCFAYGHVFITSRVGYQLVYKLRRELFDHLQKLSLAYHTRSRSGELLTKVTSDTSALRDVFAESSLTMAAHALTVLGMFVVLWFMNWQLSLIVMAVFPLLCYSLFAIYGRIRRSARKQREREGKVASRIAEVLGSVNLVQAFARERYEQEKFEAESSRTLDDSVRTARMEAAASRSTEIVSALGLSACVFFGGMHVLGGRMTLGDLVVFTAYLSAMYKPLRTLARFAGHLSKAAVSAERIEEILSIQPEEPGSQAAIPAKSLHGQVSFDNVHFGYSGGRGVLNGISFRVNAGERVALVGASGAGKSTIASLILRLYHPQGGAIRIDGVDIRDYQRESLCREIGIVLQDSVLFGASVRENIAYGKPEASLEEIEAAARRACAHDFIAALPNGYETVVGERGCTLSGGQRQRLCLARAIIKQPSILILDEPTSAVDAESAALIQSAVNEVHRGKTLLLIAHRFTGLDTFDRILVLRDGNLAEEGTHRELLERGGYYCALLHAQKVVPEDALALS